jgi:hypothetical protein
MVRRPPALLPILLSVGFAACGSSPAGPDAASLPDHLKGTVPCGNSSCAEGELCISACIGYCGGQVPDGGSCPSGCNFYPGHGCYSCSRTCQKVPPACYTPCSSPPDPVCTSSGGCPQVRLCDKDRQQGCAPY